jgi:prepilin-type N-terminal cleavage/methylation domain-containing protein
MIRKYSRRRRAFSLLEVILSIAILGGAMVVIGHGFFLGYRSVRNARLIGQANRLADSSMAELAAGVVEPVSVSSQAIPNEKGWVYSIDIQRAPVQGLLTAIVKVENPTSRPPMSISITRLVIDPSYDPLEETEE